MPRGADARLAVSPIRFLAPTLLATVRPEAEVAAAAPPLSAELRNIVVALDDATTGPGASDLRLSSVQLVADMGVFVLPLARRGRAAVLKRSSPAADELRADLRAWKELDGARSRARKGAGGWHAR